MPSPKDATTSDPEAWRLAKAMLAEVLDLPIDERPAYLDAHCRDPELRREIDVLLGQSDDDFLKPGTCGASSIIARFRRFAWRSISSRHRTRVREPRG